MKQFFITTEYIELIRLLKAVGPFATEQEVKDSITDGLVSVDNQIETRRKCKIRPGQIIDAGTVQIKVMKGSKKQAQKAKRFKK